MFAIFGNFFVNLHAVLTRSRHVIGDLAEMSSIYVDLFPADARSLKCNWWTALAATRTAPNPCASGTSSAAWWRGGQSSTRDTTCVSSCPSRSIAECACTWRLRLRPGARPTRTSNAPQSRLALLVARPSTCSLRTSRRRETL